MPGGLKDEELEFIRGKKITDEQYKKLRKQL
jgi:hypothetical protein